METEVSVPPSAAELSRWQRVKRMSGIAGRFTVLSVALFAGRHPMPIPREWYMPKGEVQPMRDGEAPAVQPQALQQPIEMQLSREGEV